MKDKTAQIRQKREKVIKLLSGDEPTVDLNKPYPEAEMIRAYSWYSSNYTVEDGREWLMNYLKINNHSATVIANVKSKQIPMVVCSIARMLSRDITLPEKTMKFFNNFINTRDASPVEIKTKKIQYIKPPTVDNKIEMIMANIEEATDKLLNTWECDYSLYNDIKAQEIKSPSVKEIHTRLMPRISQIIELMDGNTNIKEYYSSYSKAELKKLIDFHRMLDNDCKKALQATKIVRQRKKKQGVNADKVLKSFKYKKEDNSLKTVSVDPAKILTSSTLVVYNTKYKRMTVFVANEDSKLSVKGTSILNYDESKSLSKRVKKPEEAITAILGGTPNSILKTFAKFKSEAKVPTNRINEDTIILRAV